mmetsp:Transcript_67990/g.113035  ORF Transcript_67990/g.113035 Transcript_67990/m.113035 type:complete len:150 (-) Transcript_67990:79-528(-)
MREGCKLIDGRRLVDRGTVCLSLIPMLAVRGAMVLASCIALRDGSSGSASSIASAEEVRVVDVTDEQSDVDVQEEGWQVEAWTRGEVWGDARGEGVVEASKRHGDGKAEGSGGWDKELAFEEAIGRGVVEQVAWRGEKGRLVGVFELRL